MWSLAHKNHQVQHTSVSAAHDAYNLGEEAVHAQTTSEFSFSPVPSFPPTCTPPSILFHFCTFAKRLCTSRRVLWYLFRTHPNSFFIQVPALPILLPFPFKKSLSLYFLLCFIVFLFTHWISHTREPRSI